MAKALIQSGFPAQNVMLRTDLDLRDMQSTIRSFKNTVKAGDDVVIYYTGHGMQIGGNNYLLPKNFSRKVNSNDEVVKNNCAVTLCGWVNTTAADSWMRISSNPYFTDGGIQRASGAAGRVFSYVGCAMRGKTVLPY